MAAAAPARRRSLAAAAALLLLAVAACAAPPPPPPNTTDTWAVIVSSSRYWLNYRHSANALGMYQAVRRLGVPDARILLMLADQPACSPRNVFPGRLILEADQGSSGGGSSNRGGSGSSNAGGSEGSAGNLASEDVEVDYRGREASVDSLLRVLTGHHPPGVPTSKRLASGPSSRVLVYLTGHGGDEFLKFHDQEELLASDLAAAVGQMAAAGRYGELLLLADTCQASTLFGRVAAPNVLAIASSKLGQSSYAHHLDGAVGQHVVDQLTFHLHRFLTTRLPPHPAAPAGVLASAAGSAAGSGAAGSFDSWAAAVARGPSLQQLLDYVAAQRMSSDVQVRSDLFPRPLRDIPAAHFFAAAAAEAGPAGAGVASAEAAGGGARAAAAVLRLVQAHRAPGEQDGSPAAGPISEQEQQQQAQQQQEPPPAPSLFALLEAAGGKRGGGGGSRAPAKLEAAAVAAAWGLAAAVLARVLAHKPRV